MLDKVENLEADKPAKKLKLNKYSPWNHSIPNYSVCRGAQRGRENLKYLIKQETWQRRYSRWRRNRSQNWPEVLPLNWSIPGWSGVCLPVGFSLYLCGHVGWFLALNWPGDVPAGLERWGGVGSGQRDKPEWKLGQVPFRIENTALVSSQFLANDEAGWKRGHRDSRLSSKSDVVLTHLTPGEKWFSQLRVRRWLTICDFHTVGYWKFKSDREMTRNSHSRWNLEGPCWRRSMSFALGEDCSGCSRLRNKQKLWQGTMKKSGGFLLNIIIW